MIGKRLKRLRLENGLTQITLWEISGVSNVQIGRYEKGSSKPQVKTLAKLAKALEVEPNFFTDKKKLQEEICLEDHLERLKQSIRTFDDLKMLISFTEINRIAIKK